MKTNVMQKYKNRIIVNAILTLGIFAAPFALLMAGKEVKHIWFNIIAYVVFNGVLAIVFWKCKDKL